MVWRTDDWQLLNFVGPTRKGAASIQYFISTFFWLTRHVDVEEEETADHWPFAAVACAAVKTKPAIGYRACFAVTGGSRSAVKCS